MTLDAFGYRGNFVFTPPQTYSDSNEQLTVIATPYGDPEILSEAMEKMLSEFEAQVTDPDTTSPFAKLTCLTPPENTIYTSVQFLNDFIYSNHNKNKINFGCDIFCAYKYKNQVIFTQIGWPLVVLNQGNKNTPISSDYSQTPSDLDQGVYVPNHLVGLESSVNVKIQSFELLGDDTLLLLKSNETPDSLLTVYPSPLEKIAESFAATNPNQGFWLGSLKF